MLCAQSRQKKAKAHSNGLEGGGKCYVSAVVDHVCASGAIPLVFQPVRLRTPRGMAFSGDSCVRLQQPLSPAIRLRAEKVFAIGVRCENLEHQAEPVDQRDPSLAQVMGVLFNVMFLDYLAADLEHLERLNQLLADRRITQPSIEQCGKIRPLWGHS
jgi:predicted acylesterase/phospholipase RssA